MILVINGSPMTDGNLHRMLQFIADCSGCETEMLHLASLDIAPCYSCGQGTEAGTEALHAR